MLTVRFKLLFLAWLFGAALASAQSAPVIFFSDLASGPKNGGELVNDLSGAYVTLYGNFFGSSQGSSTVSLNGSSCLRVVSWGTPWQWYQRIVVQLGSDCSSGNFVVTVNGIASNPLPFAVNSGRIYFVSTKGSDHNSGSFTSPWKTILHAVEQAGTSAGNIIYALEGVRQTTYDGEGWDAVVTLRNQWCRGTASQPNALIAYPGASVTIGSTTGNTTDPDIGIRAAGPTAGGGACQGAWTFAELQLRGGIAILLNGQSRTSPSSNWRLVGNDLTCPNGDGATACFETMNAANLKVYGNKVHDTGVVGPPTASALYQGVYFSTDTNHVDFGWNTIANVHGCRGLQLHSTDGYNLYDYSIHDNVIHDTQCDGILLATTDPSQGKISVYNNVIYNAGIGPNNPKRTGAWNCIYLHTNTKKGPTASGTIEIYGNTMYNCGSFVTPPYEGSNNGVQNVSDDPVRIHMYNNIIFQVNTAAPYFDNESSLPDGIYGANNVFFGIGPAPASAYVTGTIKGNPLFVRPGMDFHLSSSKSAAHGAGSKTTLVATYDHDGLLRLSPATVGAYEYPPAPPEKVLDSSNKQ